MSQVSFAKYVNFLSLLAVADVPDPHKVPIEVSGVSAVIGSARGAFGDWVQANHPSLHDDLWGQYWLAGVAAGLAYCHKTGQPEEQRLAGLIYAAANLKRYAAAFKLPQPTHVELLYDESQSDPFAPKKVEHNLPAQPTPFIGRTAQLAALKELILKPEVRLITLMGPGGTGKTRLSLQVTQESLDHFPNGAFFVPLADDTDSNQFIARVAQQLEVREGGRPLLDNIKDYLRDKNLLLVLDNFEQLIAVAPVVANLLAAAPQLKIITSSRIALKIQSEREYPVPPLEMPQRESTLEELAGYESIKLFVERARAAQPNFALTKDNATSVSEICLRVDGLPLALELAAARIKLLSPQAILSRLDDQLKLLTGGARDLPSRQQTLRNTLEWSYNLLNDDEKKLYARLSVFVGGFTLEAAEAVCNAENKFDILEGLTALVDNSLLRQEEVNGEPRFGMLETIRAYAVERLAQSGETPVLHASHAQFFGNIILNQAGYEIYSSNAWRWLNWFEHELDNIRATLNWSLTTPQGIQLGVGLISMLFWFWYRRGHFIEGKQWAEKFLEVPNVQNTPAMRAAALASSGMMALWQGQQETALAKLEATLAIEQQLEDDRMVATSQMATGIAFINMGRDGDAKPLLEEASQFFEVNNPYFHGLTLVHLGNAELGLGHPDKAYAYHSKAETAARQINENWLLSFALNNLGEVARTMGQYDLARKYYEECETLLPDSGDKGDRARFVHNLGYIAQHEGDYERAESQFRRSLKMFRQLGNRRGMAECMAGLAGLKAHQGQVEWGAVMLSAADSVLKATGGAWWPADRVEVEATQEFIRSALDEAEWNGAQKTGRAMTLEEALGFASETE
jgi:predicted ATPase